MNKVHFFCIGAQKAGTTLLHDILKQHSEIYLPIEKEAHFFDVNEVYAKGLKYYFETYFKTFNDEKCIGNINPNLQIENRSIDRILDCFGADTKIIFLLRDPVKRAFSHYLMSKKRGYEEFDFLDALENEPLRLSSPKYHKDYESEELGHFEKNHFGYISRGQYSGTLKYIYKQFPKDNVRVFIFEEFLANKEIVINEIQEFLGVNHQELNLDLKSNPAEKAKFLWVSKFLNTPSKIKDFLKQVLPKNLRVVLKQFVYKKNLKLLNDSEKKIPYDRDLIKNRFFVEDINELEKVLGKKIKAWE
ncbi:sulfotransferase [Mangrovimonas sp. ST2L15]|uniref:sulfotransferase family protein n=1 Tax=Mangrovimonas sp. ST2L15 TaxID=1645916 RepID=UPI0006B48F61|nr:sulfotransferase [Mangrovimonas sp. ST2L15]